MILLSLTFALEFSHLSQVIVLRIVGEGPRFNPRASPWFPRKICTEAEVQGCPSTTTQTRLHVRGVYIPP